MKSINRLLKSFLSIALMMLSAQLWAENTISNPESEIWELAERLLNERIEQNTQLKRLGLYYQLDFVIDMYEALRAKDNYFIPKDIKEIINSKLKDIYIKGGELNKADTYLIIMLPATPKIPEVDNKVQNDLDAVRINVENRIRILKTDELISALIIGSGVTFKKDVVATEHKAYAEGSQAVNAILKDDLYDLWLRNSPARANEYTDKITYINSEIDRYVALLKGEEIADNNAIAKVAPIFTPLPSPISGIGAIPAEEYNRLYKLMVSEAAQQVNNAIYTGNDHPYDASTFRHFINNQEFFNVFLNEKGFLGLEHKLAYLKEATGVQFYVVYVSSEIYLDDYNTFARNVFEQSALNEKSKAVLITVPYGYLRRYISNTVKHPYLMPGVASSPGLLDNTFSSMSFQSKHLGKLVMAAYQNLEKPFRRYVYAIRWDGSVLFIPQQEVIIRNYKAINELVIYYDKVNIEKIKSLEREKDRRCASYNVRSCLEYEALVDEARMEAKDNPDFTLYGYENVIKERYLIDYHKGYFNHVLGEKRSWLPTSFYQVFKSDLPDEVLYPVSPYDFAYDVADWGGTIPVISTPFDALGFVTAFIEGASGGDVERAVTNSAIYSASLISEGVPSSSMKAVAGGAFFVILKKSKKVILSFKNIDEIGDFFNVDKWVAEKLLKGGFADKFIGKNDLLLSYIQGIAERDIRSNFMSDLVDNPKLFERIGKEPWLVNAWSALEKTSFKTDIKWLESFDALKKNDLLKLVDEASEAEVAAIHRYTVNNFELTRGAYTGTLTPKQQEWVDLVNSGLDKLRPNRGFQGKVFRGTNRPESEIIEKYVNVYNEGVARGITPRVNEPPLLSTSKSTAVAEDFIQRFKSPNNAEIMFEITSKRGVDIDDISDYGKKLGPKNHPDRLVQEEVILSNNQDYEILDVIRTTQNDGSVRYLIKLSE